MPASGVERDADGVTVRIVLDGERPKSWNMLKDWRSRKRENDRIALRVEEGNEIHLLQQEGEVVEIDDERLQARHGGLPRSVDRGVLGESEAQPAPSGGAAARMRT